MYSSYKHAIPLT